MSTYNMRAAMILSMITNFLSFQFYAHAQEATKTDEELITNIIERANNGERSINFTDSVIRVFPDLPYPQVGKQRTKEELKLWDKIKKERSNEKLVRNPIRIVISSAKDIAYVYGSFTVDYDDLKNVHVHHDGSFLSIWRKVQNEWMVEAMFNRYDEKK